MKDVPSLGLTAFLLVSGCALPTGAPPALQAGASPEAAGPAVSTMEEVWGDQGEGPLIGTVRGIDHRTGLIALDTPGGLVELVATPAEIQDLAIGDELVVYIEDEESALSGEEPQPPLFRASPEFTPIGGGAEEAD
jgi:hypothetical protein